MKNSALILAIALFTAFVTTAFAQESTTIDVSSSPIAKGQLFLGATSNGGLNFSTSYTDFNSENDGKNKSTSFSLNPTAGYFIINNLAVGGQVSFATSKFKSGDYEPDFIPVDLRQVLLLK